MLAGTLQARVCTARCEEYNIWCQKLGKGPLKSPSDGLPFAHVTLTSGYRKSKACVYRKVKRVPTAKRVRTAKIKASDNRQNLASFYRYGNETQAFLSETHTFFSFILFFFFSLISYLIFGSCSFLFSSFGDFVVDILFFFRVTRKSGSKIFFFSLHWGRHFFS